MCLNFIRIEVGLYLSIHDLNYILSIFLKIFELFFTNSQLEIIPPLHPIIISNIDSTVLQNKKYHTLIEVDANKYIYDNIKYRLFAKNIGLVKYIDRDSNQWELIKYNISQ
jgi:hypothetical protein